MPQQVKHQWVLLAPWDAFEPNLKSGVASDFNLFLIS